jgi:hypothetical protein
MGYDRSHGGLKGNPVQVRDEPIAVFPKTGYFSEENIETGFPA